MQTQNSFLLSLGRGKQDKNSLGPKMSDLEQIKSIKNQKKNLFLSYQEKPQQGKQPPTPYPQYLSESSREGISVLLETWFILLIRTGVPINCRYGIFRRTDTWYDGVY